MKKSLLLLVMLSVTTLAVAQTFTWSSYSYTVTKAPSSNLRGECQLNGLASGVSVSGAIEITPSVAYNGSYYNVTSVKASAFAGNDKITAVRFPYGMRTIGSASFQKCTKLVSVYVPSSVTILHTDWMYNCWFTKDAEFVMNISNKTTMNNADLNATNVGIDAGAKLYVPREMVADYKASKTWSKFTSVNPDYKTAYDFKLNAYYTVTSSNKTTINGTNYDGSLKVVHGMGSLNAKIAVMAASNDGKVYAPHASTLTPSAAPVLPI